MVCPSCDAAIPDGVVECPFCGASFQAQKYPWQVEMEKAEKKEKSGKVRSAVLIVLGSLLGASLVALLTVFVIIPAVKNLPQKLSELRNPSYTDRNEEAAASIEPFAAAVESASTIYGDVLGGSNLSGERTFGADRAVDGNVDSCWCVNTAWDGGAGAEIRFDLDAVHTVTGLRIVNGNQHLPEEDIYRSNGQIMDFTVQTSSGVYSFTASFNPGDPNFYEQLDFPEPVETDHIVITVDSSYVGVKYGYNVCLTELEVLAIS